MSSRIEVGRLLRHHGERFLAAGSGQEDEAFRREHDFQQLPVVAFVVHDQDACRVVGDVAVVWAHARRQLSRDGREKFLVAHRLGDVAVTAGGANALLVALHRQGGEGDHRNGARRVVPLEQRRGLEAVHAGKLDVHQDQVGLLVARQRQPGLGIRRAEHGMARRLQQEDRQRHVGGVVLDDQDLGHVRRPRGAPTWPAGLRP